jgi:hypothetical protein
MDTPVPFAGKLEAQFLASSKLGQALRDLIEY